MSGVFNFIGRPALEALPPHDHRVRKAGRQLYQLIREFSCETPEFGTITAPAGMVTDLASIPRAAFTWMSPDNPVILFPSLIHDVLYETQGRAASDFAPLSRKQSDDLLRKLMLACGARSTQAWLVYQAVRIGGGWNWKPS